MLESNSMLNNCTEANNQVTNMQFFTKDNQ